MDLKQILNDVYEKGADELYSQLNVEDGNIEDLEKWKKTKDGYINQVLIEIKRANQNAPNKDGALPIQTGSNVVCPLCNGDGGFMEGDTNEEPKIEMCPKCGERGKL